MDYRVRAPSGNRSPAACRARQPGRGAGQPHRGRARQPGPAQARPALRPVPGHRIPRRLPVPPVRRPLTSGPAPRYGRPHGCGIHVAPDFLGFPGFLSPAARLRRPEFPTFRYSSPRCAGMIMETFFLVEEKRPGRTQSFQDLLLACAIHLLCALCPVVRPGGSGL